MPADTPMRPDAATLLRQIADNPELMAAAHLAIEDYLVMLRDSGMLIGGLNSMPRNGFVIREKDGSPSEIIRMGTKSGIEMALMAIADHIEANGKGESE